MGKQKKLLFMTKASCMVVLHLSGVGDVKAFCISSLSKIITVLNLYIYIFML